MSNLRSKMIRLAASMPKGSPERKALLNVLATRMKNVRVTIPEDTYIRGYGTLYAGEYLVKMPVDYDPDKVEAEDIVLDSAITVVDDQ